MFFVFFPNLCRSHHFWNAETMVVHTYLAMEHVHHELLEIIGMIQQQFSSNENKTLMPRMLFVRYKFRQIEHNNKTLCTHFPIYHSCVSDTCWWHKNGAVPNLHNTNCSGAPPVVWNPHLILVHLVTLKDWSFFDSSNTRRGNVFQKIRSFHLKLQSSQYSWKNSVAIEEFIKMFLTFSAEVKSRNTSR